MALPAPSTDGTVLITGASSGLGAEFARQLAARGHGVTLVARREARLRELADELTAMHGVRAEPLACDLIDEQARAELPARVAELGLRVDMLVSNAGFATGGPFHETDLTQEIEQIRILCEAQVVLTGLFYPEMVRRRSGTVIIVGSTAGFMPLPNSAGYGAAKAHAVSFAEALSAEARRFDVTVTCLCPGPVRTEMFEKHDHPVERLPSPLWKNEPDVVRAALDGAERGKRVVVPGALIRAGSPLTRFAPRFLELPIVERIFR